MKKAFMIFGILVVAFLSIYAITKRPFSIPAANWTSVTMGPTTTFEDSVITEGKIYPEAGTSSSYLDLGASMIYLKESGDAYVDIRAATGWIGDGVWIWQESAYPGTDHFKIDVPGDSVWVEILRVGDKIYSESDESSSYLNLGASMLYLKESGDPYADIRAATADIADGDWEWKSSVYPGPNLFKIDVLGDSVWTKNLVAEGIIRSNDDDSDSYLNLGISRFYLNEGGTEAAFITPDSANFVDATWVWQHSAYPGIAVFTVDVEGGGVIFPFAAPVSEVKGSIWLLNEDDGNPDTIAVDNGTSTKYFVSL